MRGPSRVSSTYSSPFGCRNLPEERKNKIVIAGGGFAGLSAAMYFDKRLARRADIEVVLISRIPARAAEYLPLNRETI
jgi:NADPH-dependent 2,4-dienoyl-CoA reductase/sulfur reductase-like enzyme